MPFYIRVVKEEYWGVFEEESFAHCPLQFPYGYYAEEIQSQTIAAVAFIFSTSS